MTDLPRPDVTVTSAPEGHTDVIISRDGKARSYRAEGVGVNEKIADAVRKVIADPHTAEFLPAKRRE